MKKIGIFFGSTSGNTETASEFMKEYLEANNFEVKLFDMSECDTEEINNFTNIIIGCPTWNIGDLQDDWDSLFDDYKDMDFDGITGAFFGCGDQSGYPHNFLDAVGILAKPFVKNDGQLIGECSRDEYEFDDSVALNEDDTLMGLGLDYDNCDDDECELLMINWLDEIMESFK